MSDIEEIGKLESAALKRKAKLAELRAKKQKHFHSFPTQYTITTSYTTVVYSNKSL